MSENIVSKALSLLGKAWISDPLCPYQTPVEDIGVTPQPTIVVRPQPIGSAELVFGDVPYVPPEFKP